MTIAELVETGSWVIERCRGQELRLLIALETLDGVDAADDQWISDEDEDHYQYRIGRWIVTHFGHSERELMEFDQEAGAINYWREEQESRNAVGPGWRQTVTMTYHGSQRSSFQCPHCSGKVTIRKSYPLAFSFRRCPGCDRVWSNTDTTGEPGPCVGRRAEGVKPGPLGRVTIMWID